jgi:hypothetical protein
VELRACCIPLPILGFAAFPDIRPAAPLPVCRSAAFPATRFVPLEEFPSAAAAPCHHGRCPLAVPPHASPRSRATRCQVHSSTRIRASDADFEALLRLRVRSVFAPLPVRHALSFRWALFPFKGCSSSLQLTLPAATMATGGLVRGAIVQELRSAPVRAASRRCCHRATGMPRSASRPAPGSPLRRSGRSMTRRAPKCSSRPRLGERLHRSADDRVPSRSESPRRAAATGSLRSSPWRQERPCLHPEPDRGRVSGAPLDVAVVRASAAGVCPEPKFTTLAHRGPSWGS